MEDATHFLLPSPSGQPGDHPATPLLVCASAPRGDAAMTEMLPLYTVRIPIAAETHAKGLGVAASVESVMR